MIRRYVCLLGSLASFALEVARFLVAKALQKRRLESLSE